jgi:DNA-binding NtrC family response regulator
LYQSHINQRSQSQVQALTSARIAAAAGDMRWVNGISESEALRWRKYGPDPDVVEHYLREGAPTGISEALLEKLPAPHELIAALDEKFVELRRNDGERQVTTIANVDLVPLSFLFEYFPLEEITGMFDYNSKTGQLEVDWSSCEEGIIREAVEVGAVSDVAVRCKRGTIYLHDGSYVDASLHSSEAELGAMSPVDVIFELFRISSARLPGAGVRQFQSTAEGNRVSEVINLRPNKLNLDLARRLDHLRSGKSDEAVADDEVDLDSAFAVWETAGQFSRVASETTSQSESECDVRVSVGDLSSLGPIVSAPDVVSLELSVVECLAAAGVSDSRIEIVISESGEKLRECGLSPALCDVWGTYEVGMCTVVLALRRGVRVLNPETVDVIMKVAVQRLRTLPACRLAMKINAPGFIAEDPRTQRVLSQLRDIAVLDGVENPYTMTHVLLAGERGVGKELLAKLIQEWSRRSSETYQVFNLGAISRELAVSELFGSKKGSFTGSVADRIGYIQKAENGTLFVDELDEGSGSMQALLKRVVQFGTYNVVGNPDERLCNVRFIAATNRVLGIKADLKDRFWIVEVPALRERRVDIAPLAQYFASQHEYSLPEPVLSYLTGLQWPGNVRQLQTLVHRVCAIAKTADEVNLGAFEGAVRESGGNPGVCDFGTDQFPPLRVGETLRGRLNAQEQWQIENALRFTNWNKTATARLLGISRPHLRERMKALGMSMEKPQDSENDRHEKESVLSESV